MISKIATTALPVQPGTLDSPGLQRDSPGQDCSFLRLPAELRLEIYRLAFQQDLDAINTTPQFYKIASKPFRGALACLHTSRTLRTESIDAIGTFAQESRAALQEQARLANPYTDAVVESWFARGVKAKASVMAAWSNSRRLHIGTLKIEEVCNVLRLARDSDWRMELDRVMINWKQMTGGRARGSQGAIATG